MQLTTPLQAAKLLQGTLGRRETEEFWALALSADKRLLHTACLFRGTVDLCMFHPRDVFRFALRYNAAALIVAHNHPSGSCEPSVQDFEVTHHLLKASDLMQIPIEDHLIVVRHGYFSFLEAGQIRGPV